MPDNKQVRKDLDDLLKSAPSETESTELMVATGLLMQSSDKNSFMIKGLDGQSIELNRDAVESFEVLSSGPGGRMANVTLNGSLLDAATRDRIRPRPGDLKPAFDKLPPTDKFPPSDKFPPLDKNPPFDKLPPLDKNPPFDKLPPQDKNPPFDTLKEPADDTIKEQPFDTLKEIGGGDTLKEQPFDTLKEIGGGDTFKEVPSDTLVEAPEFPGGDPLLARSATIQGNPTMNAQMATTGFGPTSFTPHPTLKEVPFDGTFKELVKDVIMDGTGIMDSLVEGRPDMASMFGNPAVQPGGGVPFVLATPHHASQGAVAQQMLAVQAMQGRMGF